MVKQFGIAALVGTALLLPMNDAKAQHGHGGHSGHGGHGGHGGHSGIHIGIGGHGHGHSGGHGFRHHHHPTWSYVLPHYETAYRGTYYVDGGVSYYTPQPLVNSSSSTYVVAKPAPVQFGGYSHVDDLAGRLERVANELCLDLYYNYRNNPGYADFYRQAYRVLDTAKYIHAKEHQGDRAEVARRLDEVDDVFHNVQFEVRRWARQPIRQIGQGGALTKLDLVESALHHLMNDVGVQGVRHQPPGSVSAPAGLEIAPPPEPVRDPTPEAQSVPIPTPPTSG